MTPEEARDLLDGTTPANEWWADIGAAAPDMAAMIAGMREEWGVEVTHYRDGDLHTRWGYTDRKDAAAFAHYMGRDPRWNAARVVRRYGTEPEEIK